MTQYPTQSHYLDTELTTPCPILLMSSARLGSDKYNFYKSSLSLEREGTSWFLACALAIRPPDIFNTETDPSSKPWNCATLNAQTWNTHYLKLQMPLMHALNPSRPSTYYSGAIEGMTAKKTTPAYTPSEHATTFFPHKTERGGRISRTGASIAGDRKLSYWSSKTNDLTNLCLLLPREALGIIRIGQQLVSSVF